MPAQHIHILINPTNRTFPPWYELEKTSNHKIYTPEWTFEENDLKRFE